MQSVCVLIKPASGLCNMRCDYCFYCDETAKRQQAFYGLMTEETLKNVLRKCILPAEKDCMIAFQGGEPTLCGLPFFQKAVEYAWHFNRSGIRLQFALQTNGYDITEEWCHFFAENHFLIGISVDGVERIHDRYRHSAGGKAPTYCRVMDTISLLEQYHVDYNILTVVHREVAEHIEEIYQEYRRRGWHYLQFITCLDPLGEPRGQKPYSLRPTDYGRFLMRLFDLWYQDYLRGNAPYIRQFENYVGILLGMPPESCEQQGRCGIQYVVEADGSVYPCDFYVLDEWKLGNLNSQRLGDLDQRRAQLGFQKQSFPLPEQCANCPWLKLCRNGCFRSRVTEFEDNTGLNYFCKGYQMFFQHVYERLLLIAKQVEKGR